MNLMENPMTTNLTESQRQKTEADNFVVRVSTELPHLGRMVAWQTIFDKTVEGMKTIGIYRDGILTEAQFMAGLQNAMSSGLLPKPPALVPPEPTAEEIAAQQEQRRLADKARRDEQSEQETARLMSEQGRTKGISRHEFHNPIREAAEAAEGIRSMFAQRQEEQTKAEAEGLSLYYLNGRPDPNSTRELLATYAKDQNGKILWRETLALRKKIQENHHKQQRFKRDSQG
jgi:hypothetical protein